MSWVLISLIVSIISALVSIFDKTITYRFGQSSKVLPLLVGILQTSVGLSLLIVLSIFNNEIFIFSDNEFIKGMLFASLSGVLFGTSGNIMLRILHGNEVSRTVPITQTYPLFTVLIASFFLDEIIATSQWISIFSIILGAAVISTNTSNNTNNRFTYQSALPLLLSSFIQSIAYAFAKLALGSLPVILTHALRELFLGLVFISINLRKQTFIFVKELWDTKSPAIKLVGINELVTANISLLLIVWALSLGPVSLVSSIASTRVLFVVILGLIVGKYSNKSLGEELHKRTIATKVIGALLIVIGIFGITVN